jgi:hypothetical protein
MAALRRLLIAVFGKGCTVVCILEQRLIGVNTDGGLHWRRNTQQNLWLYTTVVLLTMDAVTSETF